MTEMLRLRVERKLRREAEKVKRKAILFPIQTETPEDEMTGPRKRRAAIMDQL